MQHKQGEERNQLFMFSLESAIATDSFVRVVDAFVDSIDRNEHADAIEANAKRVNNNPDYYRKRQQIAEHMYGTLKRQRGYIHTNLRGKNKVLGETGLFFIGYNLTSCIIILRVTRLIKALKECCLPIYKRGNGLILSVFNEFFSPGKSIAVC